MSATAFVRALSDVDVAKKAQRLAETAIDSSGDFNAHTLADVAALRRLRDARFVHAPHLLNWTWRNDVGTEDA
jgi:hypothetical protein